MISPLPKYCALRQRIGSYDVKEPSDNSREKRATSVDLEGDVTPCNGSGFCIQGKFGKNIFSNWHVFEGARNELEEKMTFRFQSDIAVLPIEETFAVHGADSIQNMRLPHASINNRTLPGIPLEFHALGSDIYTIKGKPIRFMMKYGTADNNHDVEMFAFVLPASEIRERYQFRGTSGSPITIQGSGEIAGIGHHAVLTDKYMYVIFSGPDDIRAAFRVSEEQRATRASLLQTTNFVSPAPYIYAPIEK